MRRFAFTTLLLCAIGPIGAQEVSKFSFALGGGFTQPVGNTSRNLDEGWNVQGSVGFNFNQYVGAMVQLDYNRFGINGATLNNVGFPGGDVNVFSATLDPIVHLTPRSRFDVYLIGGGGYYRRTQEFTEPGARSFHRFRSLFRVLHRGSAHQRGRILVYRQQTRREWRSRDSLRYEMAWQVLRRSALPPHFHEQLYAHRLRSGNLRISLVKSAR